MTLALERPANYELPAEPGITRAELAPSQEVAARILDKARPLWEDEAYQDLFYNQMGVVRTPLEEIADIEGATVLVKKEYAQDSGSYKRRGATHAVLQTAAPMVATYSTGNHGRSVVEAVEAVNRLGGNKGVMLDVPESISPVKLAPLEGRAMVAFHPTFAEAQRASQDRGTDPNVAVIDPFGHEDVIAGQCSLGYEVVADLLDRGLADKDVTIPVSTAGGGHLLGIALPVWQAKQAGVLGPNVKIVAVQPTNTDALGRAVSKVRAGEEPQNLFAKGELDTDCDALAIGEESLSPLTLAVAADPEFIDTFVTIGKEDLAAARQYTSQQVSVQVEPAAALPMAYALQHAAPSRYFVLPLTGKNISEQTKQLYDSFMPDTGSQPTTPDNSVQATTFAELSRRYSERTVWGLEEIKRRQAENRDNQRQRLGVWAGTTALHRTGLITPGRRTKM